MDARPLMACAASLFRSRLAAAPGGTVLPVPQIMPPGMTPPVTELRWDNLLLRSHRFRRAHVETLDVPGRLCVLHVCVFPPLSDATPIFGFDVVAGCARVTGIFLDLSPVVSAPDILRLRDVVHPEALAGFAIRRPPPEWGGIFSADLLAIRPSGLDEVRRAIDLARQALDAVLMAPPQAAGSAGEAAAGQSRYIMQQRRNDHTLRLLAGFIGPEAARRFIDEVLFPPVPELHVPELPAPDLSPAGAPLPGRLFSGGPPGGPPSVGRPSGLGALGLHRMA